LIGETLTIIAMNDRRMNCGHLLLQRVPIASQLDHRPRHHSSKHEMSCSFRHPTWWISNDRMFQHHISFCEKGNVAKTQADFTAAAGFEIISVTISKIRHHPQVTLSTGKQRGIRRRRRQKTNSVAFFSKPSCQLSLLILLWCLAWESLTTG
jgi:hypothetical protein